MAPKSDLPSRHSYRIAVATGLVPYVPPDRPTTQIPVFRTHDQSTATQPADQATTGAQSNSLRSTPSLSTAISLEDDVFSTNSTPSTKASSAPAASAFVQGWKAAMHQTQAERPLVYSDVERFALDVTETLDEQLAKGNKLNQTGVPRRPEESEVELPFPALFRSICICDVSIMGNPVALQ